MLSKKTQTITPSYTVGISAKVKSLIAQGIDIIDLSIGEPDFNTPLAGKTKAIQAIEADLTKYDLVPGLNDLRALICKKLKDENNVYYTPSDIVVSSGAKNAITNALMATLDPGDEVIIPSPYWTSYPEMVKLCHGIPVIVNTQAKNDFKLTLPEFISKITDKTKLLLINNPSNPTGAVYTKEELEPLIAYCIEHQILILADEIYEKICYDFDFVSIPSLSEQAKAITILVNGFSKSAAMTGWRLGYTASPPEIAKAMATIQGHLVSHPSTISQWAACGALLSGEGEMATMVQTYKMRRDQLLPYLKLMPKLDFILPQGAFYLFINISAYKEYYKNYESMSGTFCEQLLTSQFVAVVPGIAFGNDNYIRISYATSIDKVIEGLSRINIFLESLESLESLENK